MNALTRFSAIASLMCFVIGVGGCELSKQQYADCSSLGYVSSANRLSNLCGQSIDVPSASPQVPLHKALNGGRVTVSYSSNVVVIADGDRVWRREMEVRRQILDVDVAIDRGRVAILSREDEAMFLSVNSFGAVPEIETPSSVECKIAQSLVDSVKVGGSRVSLSPDGKKVLLGMAASSVVFYVDSSGCRPTNVNLSWAAFGRQGDQIVALDRDKKVVQGELTSQSKRTFEITSDVPPLLNSNGAKILVGSRRSWPLRGFVRMSIFEVTSPEVVRYAGTIREPTVSYYAFLNAIE